MTFFLNEPAKPQPPRLPSGDVTSFVEGLSGAFKATSIETDANFKLGRTYNTAREDLAAQASERLTQGQIDRYTPTGNAARAWKKKPETQRTLTIARQAAKDDPEAWADLPLDEATIEADVNRRLQEEHAEARALVDMMPGGQSAAELLGGMAGATADVKNVPFLFLGGGAGSIGRVMTREAVANMAAEGFNLPQQFEMADRLEIEDPNIVSTLAMAAGAGAILGGAFEIGARMVRYGMQRNRNAPQMDGYTEDQSQAMVDTAEDILASGDPDAMAKIVEIPAAVPKDPPFMVENPINPERPPLAPTEPQPDAAPPPKPKGRRPTTLKTFVVQEGGIWKGDDGGEIGAMEYRRPGFAKKERLVRSEAGDNGGGLTVDEMRVRAIEQGFLPAGATRNDFLDALDGDVRGTARAYAERDMTDAEAWRAFDGETAPVDPDGPLADFNAMQPEDGQLFIDLEQFQLGGRSDEDIEQVVSGWMQEQGYADILNDAERAEIIATLQERGGDPEYLVEQVLTREADWVDAPETEDIPFGEPAGPDERGNAEPGSVTREAGGGGEGDAGSAVADRQTERTAAGEQTLIDGVAPVTQRDRLEAQQAAPLQGGDAPPDDGLFDLGARAQTDMFADPQSPAFQERAVAQSQYVANDIEANGDFDIDLELEDGKRLTTASEALRYLDEADEFSEIIALCGKPKVEPA